jgi:hypothetical protein
MSVSATLSTVLCPFCTHNLDANLECTICEASAQDRFTWLAVTKLRLASPGTKVMHHAPSAPMARRMRAWLGDGYRPTLAPQQPAPTPDVSFQPFDPSDRTTTFPPISYDLIIIAKGLYNSGAALPALLDGLARALIPGGSMLFGGDAVDEEGRIANMELAAEIAATRGGANSFSRLVRWQFKRDCRIGVGMGLSNGMLEAAGLQTNLLRRISPRTLFWYQA